MAEENVSIWYTGASMHMAPINRLTAEERATMELLPEPIPVTTANGIAYVTHTALIVVPDLTGNGVSIRRHPVPTVCRAVM